MSSTTLPLHHANQPKRFHYRFSQLLNVPKRVFFPVDAGVGTTRSFKITPKFDLKLEDMLNAKYLPPLGLKEFEEYLLFVEHSAENLYFFMWLRKYEGPSVFVR